MKVLANPYEAGDQLHDDFVVVSEAQLSAERREAAKALLGRTGCLGDALTYYQGVDPSHEIDAVLFSQMGMLEEQDEVYGRAITGLHAAEILLASIVSPGFYDRRDSKRVRMLGKEAHWYKVFSKKCKNSTTPYDTITEALDVILERPLATADAKTLGMGAEMLSYATTWWQIAKIKMYESDKKAYVEDDLMREVFDSFESALVVHTMAAQNMLKNKMLGESPPGIEPAEKLERKALGLKAQWRSGAILMHPMFRYAIPEQGYEALWGMIESLQKEFVEGDLLDVKKYPKNEIKGLLHELLWFVDAQMVMMAQPEEFKTIGIGPSASRLDRPMIGRPELLRGVDYAIHDTDTGDTQSLNLKSGKGETRKYHPRIKVVKEPNFQDMSLGRLMNKLRKYQEVIQSGFTLSETSEIVDRYALKSVKEELALHKNSSPSEDWPYILIEE